MYWAGGMVQLLQHQHEGLSSNPSTTKKISVHLPNLYSPIYIPKLTPLQIDAISQTEKLQNEYILHILIQITVTL
jgi:hypothetical protein